MSLQFETKIATQETNKPRYKSLKDIHELGLASEAFQTAEQLADIYKIPRETVLQILDKHSVWPIAKVLNRGEVTNEHPHGKPMGGRPKIAFNPEEAKRALDLGVEEFYGKED